MACSWVAGRSRMQFCQRLLSHPHADECSVGPSDSSVRKSPLRWSPIRMSLPPTNSPLMYSCRSGATKHHPSECTVMTAST